MATPAPSLLTPRERDVLRLAAQGNSNEEIATDLAISRRTVEAHLRTLFRKAGVTRRTQLVAAWQQYTDSGTVTAVPPPDGTASGREPAGGRPGAADPGSPRLRRRLELYEAAVRRLVDRQFPLSEERVEITVTVGEQDGQDAVVERHWSTPKPYLIYRTLRPIVARADGAGPDPDALDLVCEVYGEDIRIDVQPILEPDGCPLILILFQPGLQAETEWVLRYRSPHLWDPLRRTGADTLTWAPATLDRRHQPTIQDLTLKVVFPATWADIEVTEQHELGAIGTTRLPTGQLEVAWHGTAPLAATYDWLLRAATAR